MPEAKNDVEAKNDDVTIQIIGLFMFVWIVLGLAAFVWSLYCFGKSGTIFEKCLGLAMAIFFGPLFFVLYKFSPTYCK
jgi:type IV secretory pathway TrbL component